MSDRGRSSGLPGLEIDSEWLVATLRELVATDSRNPALVDGGPGEAAIADVVAERMREIGLEVERLEPEPGRATVVGRLSGTGGGRSLMLNGHLDTVGVEGMERPFEPRIDGGRLYGRGAYDMKGSLAACMAAVRGLVESGTRPAGDVLVAAVADEEHASLGTEDLLERIEVDGAIVTEPTDLDLCVAHKGFVWFEIQTRGRAAHGSRFEEGIDANARMGGVLEALAAHAAELTARAPHPLVGPPSLHVGTLAGGTAPSVYAARCVATVERRIVPGESVESAEAEIDRLLERLRDASDLEVSRRTGLWRLPFEALEGSALARAVEVAGERVLGSAPPRVGETYWMDAALCANDGIDTVVIGPVGSGAHAAIEWVDLDSCVRLAEILARTSLSYADGLAPA